MVIRKGFVLMMCSWLGLGAATLSAENQEQVLRDPVALGAWLYQWQCLGCHGDYARDRFGDEYDDQEELVAAIESGGCKISWARKAGGQFGSQEIEALAAYVQKWEEGEGPPDLPPLPPPPVEETSAPATVSGDAEKEPAPTLPVNENALSSVLQKLVDRNHIAHGGWLYTRNCYRCHLTYEQARMGKGMASETVQRFIAEGKTSTQMKPFSQMLGGELKNSEIKDITRYITTWEEYGEPLAIAKELMIPPAIDPADFKPLRLTRFSPVQGDRSVGGRLFRLHCSGCHGSGGEGYFGASLRSGAWTLRQDLFVKAVVKAGVPGTLMRSWDSGSGGQLAAREIDDLVAHVIHWQQSAGPDPSPAENVVGAD
ncbi:MAG: cytochrome c [Desulforhopalus sp.]|nr:cytochrome c [Desulforhopalus sp.]